jgi:hypothetical protein
MTWHGGRRGGCRGSAFLAAVGFALLTAVGAAAFAAAGCGGSTSTADLAPFVGRWDRVEAGTPNPAFTLDIRRAGDGVRLAFTNQTNGTSQTVAGTSEDGYVACTLATTDDSFLLPAGPGQQSPGVITAPPTSVNLQLSVDEGGQLIVDLLLSDGTLQPIWIYERTDGVSPSAPDGVSPSAAGTL